MSEALPDGWTREPLGRVAEIRTSNVDKKSYPGQVAIRLCNYMDVYSNEYIRKDLPFMDATATPQEIQRFGLEAGDVIITKDSETPDDIGIPAVVTEPCENLVCGYHLALLKPLRDRVEPTFLSKFLSTDVVASHFLGFANGSTRYGLTQHAIYSTPIYLPPLATQRRIATVLRTVDEAIEATEARIEKQQAIKQGLLQDLFTQGVTPDGQLRPPPNERPDLYQETELGLIPKEWVVASLGEVIVGNPKNGYSPQEWHEDTGTEMLGLGCLTENGFEPIQLKHAPPDDPFLSSYILAEGDILVSRSNTRERVGLVGRFRETGKPCIYPDLMMRLVPNSSIRSDFLERLLRAHPVRSQLTAAAVGTSGSMVKISGAIVKRTRILLPPVNEQQEITDLIAASEEEQLESRSALTKLHKLKSALMQDLLTGRVSADAIPSDTVPENLP